MRIVFAILALLLIFGCVTNPSIGNDSGNISKPANITLAPANLTPAVTANEIAVFETSKGNIEIELDRAKAPITVENFVTYVKSGFYDGLIFHRIIKGFMIQGGGFDSQAIQSETRPPIKNEASNGVGNTAGTVAMARLDAADSATSQFFINTKDNSMLNYADGKPGYAVFGKVISGMDVVQAIENGPVHDFGYYGDWPDDAVVIKKAYIRTAD